MLQLNVFFMTSSVLHLVMKFFRFYLSKPYLLLSFLMGVFVWWSISRCMFFCLPDTKPITLLLSVLKGSCRGFGLFFAESPLCAIYHFFFLFVSKFSLLLLLNVLIIACLYKSYFPSNMWGGVSSSCTWISIPSQELDTWHSSTFK